MSATYLGAISTGTTFARALDCALDGKGNLLIMGISNANGGGLATECAYQVTPSAGGDVFLNKFSIATGQRLWGTYFGGAGTEGGYSTAGAQGMLSNAFNMALASDGGILLCFTSSSTSLATTGSNQSALVGSSNYKEVIVIVSPNTITATAGDLVLCEGGEGTLPLNVTSPGDYSYAWSPAAALSNAFVANPTFIAHAAGTYTLTVTDNANQCQLVRSVNVTNANFGVQQPPLADSKDYPNPVTTMLNLKVTSWKQVKAVRINNLSGIRVYSSGPVESGSIDVSGLEGGIYILHMTHTDGSVHTHKFVHIQ